MNEADIKTRSVSPPLNLSKTVEWNALRTPTTPLVSDSVSDVPNGRDSNTPSYSAHLSREDANESNNESSSSDEDTTVVKQETSRVSVKAERTRPVSKTGSPSKKRSKAPVQLIPDAPRAEKDAIETFEVLETNWHQYKTLGKSKVQEDAMACECQYEHGDNPDKACGPHSDCINRLTQVECLEAECRCRSYCQNQRFQKRQYADVHIVKTEMKGFGLRAARPLKKDDFIYEYLGEVVNEPSFYKRMREYGEEGIEHFYFMMLQKDQFIDATKKGGIGRFANHSCNPNCYVARWVVGTHLRMGIFAKRDVEVHEELTFNYNVDRYGHDAQKCYCGEPNCLGFIGGKTQTDLGGMDDLYIDALGIADEVDRLGLKGSRKKKGKKLDEDFTPILKPMVEKDVPKVINAISQTTSRKILVKLLSRIKMTDDQAVLRQVTRLRGLTLMKPTLDEYEEDAEVRILILETIEKWPFVNRNKIEDAKIEPLLGTMKSSENERIGSLSSQILSQWSTLETVWRIPKKIKRDLDDDEGGTSLFESETPKYDNVERPTKRVRREETLDIKPLGVAAVASIILKPKPAGTTPTSTPIPPVIPTQPSKLSIEQIIEEANEKARKAQMALEAEAKAAASEEQKKKEERALRKQKAKEKAEKQKRLKAKGHDKSNGDHKSKKASKPKDVPTSKLVTSTSTSSSVSRKEKQLRLLVGTAVVGYLSQYRQRFGGSEEFKRHAQDITHKIVEMEKKGRTYQSSTEMGSLSEEKKAKIKAYVKKYVGRMPSTIATATKDGKVHQGLDLIGGSPQASASAGIGDAAEEVDLGDNPDSEGDVLSEDEPDGSQGEETDSGEEDVEMDNPTIQEDNRMEVDVQ